MIQVIGYKKNKATAKAIRFFKERGVEIQYKELKSKALSEGELKNICQSISAQELIDKESIVYKKKGFQYMQFDAYEEIFEDNQLLKLPIVREKRKVSVGYQPDSWKEWVKK